MSQFNRGTDEGLYGLGQHQNRQMNYNGEDVELAQHNMDIAIPYLLSTRGYGILWDNNSITRVGDPEPYEKLGIDWKADYYLGEELVLSRGMKSRSTTSIFATKGTGRRRRSAPSRRPPPARTPRATRCRRNGSCGPAATFPPTGGNHKFRLYSSSYVKVFADGKEVLSRWRQNWNPWYHNFDLALDAGKPVDLRIEWEPNQGYIALFHADPLPEQDRHSVSFASEAAKAIDYYVVPGDEHGRAGGRISPPDRQGADDAALGLWLLAVAPTLRNAGAARRRPEAISRCRHPDRYRGAGLVLLARGKVGLPLLRPGPFPRPASDGR